MASFYSVGQLKETYFIINMRATFQAEMDATTRGKLYQLDEMVQEVITAAIGALMENCAAPGTIGFIISPLIPTCSNTFVSKLFCMKLVHAVNSL